MSKPKSQVILVGVLGAVFGGVVYMQRETYFGGGEPAVTDGPAIVAVGGSAAVSMPPAVDGPVGPTGPAIVLEQLIGINPFKQSSELKRLFEPPPGTPLPRVADARSTGPRLVSQAVPEAAPPEDEPVEKTYPEPKVEAVFVDRSGRWRAIVGSQRVGLGDLLIDYTAGAPYAEVIAIDADGVDIRLLDEDELAVDPFN